MAVYLKDLSKAFGEKRVLDSFSFDFPATGCIAFLGPSGCGKTTLLRLLSGLEEPDSGKIAFSSEMKISYLFQEDRLLPALTAKSNIMAVLRAGDTTNGLLASQWLARVGLSREEDAYPSGLSGGMKRRVAIARAMAYGGDILLLDEPFQGLDFETKARMRELVLTGHDARRRLTLLVTHDAEEALAFADRILILDGPPLTVKDTVSVDIPVEKRKDAQDILMWHREYIRRKTAGIWRNSSSLPPAAKGYF